MNIFFAGCARDCGDKLSSNVSAILALAENPWCGQIKVFIAENSSKDNTREVITHLAASDARIVPVFLEDLDLNIPVREARLAFCRDQLLAEIRKCSTEGLYVPIDLDSDIASSIEVDTFIEACRLVASGTATGIFPSSSPYYYDIHALREPKWCPDSCWKEIQNSNAKGEFLRLLVYVRSVSSRQKPHSQLKQDELIPIASAFGGIGVYSLNKVVSSGAQYSSTELEQVHLNLCEHVVFNGFLDRLFINTKWVISAPSEHIEFCLLPFHLKAWKIARAGLIDMKRLPAAAARRVKSGIQQLILAGHI